MKFIRLDPHPSLLKLIDCYWMMENADPEASREKIIPDGFTELIFHYRDAYRSDLGGSWQTQSHTVLAGQISSYFWLENTGLTGIIAVKFKPAALTQLFGLSMDKYKNKIADLPDLHAPDFIELREKLVPFKSERLQKQYSTITLSKKVPVPAPTR